MYNIKKFFKKISLKNKQKHVNKLYERDGLTDEVLNLQVQINQESNEYNITDDSEKIYKDFVQ